MKTKNDEGEGVSRIMEICCGNPGQLHQHTSCKRMFFKGSIIWHSNENCNSVLGGPQSYEIHSR